MLEAKQWIIKNQESIIEYYLKIPIRSGLYRSPFRKDRKPTCSFYYGKSGRLYFHDFATSEHFDVFEIVKRKYSLSFNKAVDKIISERDKFTTAEVDLDKPNLEYIPGPDNFKYFNEFGISDATLNRYGVKNARAVYINETLSWRATEKNPIFVYKFATGNFKLYRPLSADKSKKWKSNCNIQDVNGFLQLKPKGDIVFITSSMKDVMLLHELGYQAIAFNSEDISTKGENEVFIKNLILHLKTRFNRVVLFLDNDEPGIRYSKKIGAHYKLDYILLPPNTEKDISDYCRRFKKRKTRRTLNKLIKNLIINDEHLAKDFDDLVRANSALLGS